MLPSPVEKTTDTRLRDAAIVSLVALAYAVIRILCIPADPLLSNGFGHDGAYLTMVARNLLAGKGFVLEALWQVFTNPASLPMPFQNANPLYPIAMAGVARLTGVDVVRAGFIVSALASAGVLVAMTAILTRFGNGIYRALIIAFFVTLFPVVWGLSWANITDEFSLMFLLGAYAAALRSSKPVYAGVAGALFGLAWLARAMTIVAVPAMLVMFLVEFGWRRRTAFLVAIFSLAAILTAMPWFVRNYQLTGDAMRSDGSYVVSIAAYYDDAMGHWARPWHSPDLPQPITRLVRLHPGEVTRNVLRGVAPFAKIVVAGVTGASYLKLLLLIALSAVLLALRWRNLLSRTAVTVSVFLAATGPLVLVRGDTMEHRYLVVGYAIFAAWMGHTVFSIVDSARKRRYSGLERGGLAMAALFAAYVVAFPAILSASSARHPDTEEKMPLREASLIVDREYSHGSPVVVGWYPYFHSMFTGAQALSIPYSTDEFLLEYMRKYHAQFVMLSPEERDFWRPAWKVGPPPGLALVGRAGSYYVYGLSANPAP